MSGFHSLEKSLDALLRFQCHKRAALKGRVPDLNWRRKIPSASERLPPGQLASKMKSLDFDISLNGRRNDSDRKDDVFLERVECEENAMENHVEEACERGRERRTTWILPHPLPSSLFPFILLYLSGEKIFTTISIVQSSVPFPFETWYLRRVISVLWHHLFLLLSSFFFDVFLCRSRDHRQTLVFFVLFSSSDGDG